MKPMQIPEWQKEDPYTYEELIQMFSEMSISFYKQEKELEEEIKMLKKSEHFQVKHPMRAFRLFFKRILRKIFS